MPMIILFALLLCGAVSVSADVSYILGSRNQRYVFAGLEYGNKVGAVVEHSVFSQGIEKQYIRVAPFYKWYASPNFYGVYSFYAGKRYDDDFMDCGAKVDVWWGVVQDMLRVKGAFISYYDNGLGRKFAYEASVEGMMSQELGVIAGLKTIPDFRDVEDRVFAGLVFDVGPIYVKPEISASIDDESRLMRMSVFFVYRSSL